LASAGVGSDPVYHPFGYGKKQNQNKDRKEIKNKAEDRKAEQQE
jgi:hypothetical protein